MADQNVKEKNVEEKKVEKRNVGKQNLTTAREIFAAVCNSNNLESASRAIDKYFATDFEVSRTPPGITPNVAGTKKWKAAVMKAFPDYHTEIEDEFADGDKVVIRWRSRGTHRGEFQGIAPTGRQITVTGITISRFADGKIAESWVGFDTQDLLRQLGVSLTQDILCSKH